MMINIADESTLISLAVFSGAFLFFFYQRISSLTSQIALLKSNDKLGRKGIIAEVEDLDQLTQSLSRDIEHLQAGWLKELTDYDNVNRILQTRMTDFKQTMDKAAELDKVALAEIESGLSAINRDSQITHIDDLSIPLAELNKILFSTINDLERLQLDCSTQSKMINELSNDFKLIKRGHGLE